MYFLFNGEVETIRNIGFKCLVHLQWDALYCHVVGVVHYCHKESPIVKGRTWGWGLLNFPCGFK